MRYLKTMLSALISDQNLDHLEDNILSAASLAIRILKRPKREDSVGSSRLGGTPDVPPGFVWPTRNGRPLGFLAQINCAEVAPNDYEPALPHTGTLHFFADILDQRWGFDPDDKSASAVFYTPGGPLAPMAPPPELDSGSILPALPIEFNAFYSIPFYRSDAFEAFEIIDESEDDKAYFELHQAVSDTSGDFCRHQLLGHPFNVQGEMKDTCQLASNGSYCGDTYDYESPHTRHLEAGAKEWRLLLQIDTEEDINLKWGNGGTMYFWIREQDLRHKAFDKCWMIIQC